MGGLQRSLVQALPGVGARGRRGGDERARRANRAGRGGAPRGGAPASGLRGGAGRRRSLPRRAGRSAPPDRGDDPAQPCARTRPRRAVRCSGVRSRSRAGGRMSAIACPVRAAALARPEALAIAFGTERWTYRRLDAEVGRFSALLAAHRVGAGDRVCVLSHNRPELVALWFALLRAGAALVPLNARLSASELAVLVELAQPKLSLADDALRSRGSRGRSPSRRRSGRAEPASGEPRARSRRRGALHLRHHRPAEGRAAHRRQLPRERDRLGGAARRQPRRSLAREPLAVPRRRPRDGVPGRVLRRDARADAALRGRCRLRADRVRALHPRELRSDHARAAARAPRESPVSERR